MLARESLRGILEPKRRIYMIDLNSDRRDEVRVERPPCKFLLVVRQWASYSRVSSLPGHRLRVAVMVQKYCGVVAGYLLCRLRLGDVSNGQSVVFASVFASLPEDCVRELALKVVSCRTTIFCFVSGPTISAFNTFPETFPVKIVAGTV